MATESLFRETQRMRQPWVWGFLVVTTVFAFVFNSVVGVLIILLVAAFLYSIRLVTEVRPDGIYVRFAPVHRSFRRFPFEEIEGVERTQFGWLTYGGIGVRWTPNTVAYMTARGNGIRIARNNEKSVVIGSQRTSELLDIIDELH